MWPKGQSPVLVLGVWASAAKAGYESLPLKWRDCKSCPSRPFRNTDLELPENCARRFYPLELHRRRDGARLQPRRQKFHQDPQNGKGKKHKYDCGQKSFAGGEAHFVSGVSQEAFGEKLAADDDVPAHGEDADHCQTSSYGVYALADRIGKRHQLGKTEERDRHHGAEQNLNDDLRRPQARVHHEVEAAEGFVSLVNALQQVEHFEAEINDERIEQVLRDRVEAANINLFSSQATG